MIRKWLMILLLMVLAGPVAAKDADKACQDIVPPDGTCALAIDKIHPGQFSVGKIAAQCKEDKYLYKNGEEMTLKQAVKKIEKNGVPVIIGPEGFAFLADRHHNTYALYNAWKDKATADDWKDNKITVTVKKNYYLENKLNNAGWEDDGKHSFVDDAYDRGLMFPYHDGKRVDGKEAAKTFRDKAVYELDDDPYRTMGGWLKQSCGYIKTDSGCGNPGASGNPFFIEFYWGDYVRTYDPASGDDFAALKDKLEGILDQKGNLLQDGEQVGKFLQTQYGKSRSDLLVYGFNNGSTPYKTLTNGHAHIEPPKFDPALQCLVTDNDDDD